MENKNYYNSTRSQWGRNGEANDSTSNQNYTNPQYNNNSYPQSNKFNNTSHYPNTNYNSEKKKINHETNKNWLYRYNRNGNLDRYVLKETEEFYKDHLDHLKKNTDFDFNNLSITEMTTMYQNKIIENEESKTNFSELQLHPSLLDNLKTLCFTAMTPIQRYSISYTMEGLDIIGSAQTGSGKTVAFLLPVINKMLNDGPPNDLDLRHSTSAPLALIIVPTRELAEQIYKEARKLLHKTGITVAKIYGGVPHDTQIRELKNGVDIIVATPGRLIDFTESKLVNLTKIKFLIIDEADRILDMGFEPQLNTIIFEKDMPDKSLRQNLLFSATFSYEIRNIAKKFMNEYYYVSKAHEEQTTNSNIQHELTYCEEADKLLKLHEILQQIKGSVIIFLDTKRGVDDLSYNLNRANYSTIAIHGDKNQLKRQEAINKFSDGEIPILIATDVASRGLDFPNVSYVFNYELPTNIEDYTHRVGRSGRCGNSGKAVSFINESNGMIVKDLYKLFQKLNQDIPGWFEDMYRNCENGYMKYSKKSNNNNNNKFGGGEAGFSRNKNVLTTFNSNKSYNSHEPSSKPTENKFASELNNNGYKSNSRFNNNYPTVVSNDKFPRANYNK